MPKLHDNVRTYYLSNIKTLPLHKQFHLCTRLAAWEDNEAALGHLGALRPGYVPADGLFGPALGKLLGQPLRTSIHAIDLRRPFFDEFPQLRGINLAMFRVRHLDRVYGVDARPAFWDLVAEASLLDTKRRLLARPDAMRILSTYVVNFFFLHRTLLPEEPVPLEALYDIGDGYDMDDAPQAHLFIYLYTHCIIGDSDFYTRQVPSEALPTYRRMLTRLERTIGDRYDDISLDAKLEFLVCARICSYDTPLHAKIQAECEASRSPKGDFIIDTHNASRGVSKRHMAGSEHRNVLFIMSNSPYRPRAVSPLAD